MGPKAEVGRREGRPKILAGSGLAELGFGKMSGAGDFGLVSRDRDAAK